MPVQGKKKWVIVLLIYVDFRQDGTYRIDEITKLELNELFDDLITCRLDEGLSLYVIVNRIRYLKRKIDGVFESKDETFIYKIIKSTSTKNDVDLLIRINNLDPHTSSRKSQKAIDLSKSFEYILEKENNSLDNLLLITWDHGSVFGINKELIEGEKKLEELLPMNKNIHEYPAIEKFLNAKSKEGDRSFSLFDVLKESNSIVDGAHIDTPVFKLNNTFFSLLPKEKEYTELLNKLKLNKYFTSKLSIKRQDNKYLLEFKDKSDSNELKELKNSLKEEEIKLVENITRVDSDGFLISDVELKIPFDVLTNQELADAINLGFKSKVVDVLLMMNCCMLNVHTAYTLQRNVNYLVAPQRGINRPAYNYRAILYSLVSGIESIQAEQLASYCVYSANSIFRQKEFSQEIETWTLFSICLKDYEKIAEQIDILAGEIINDPNIQNLRKTLKEARKNLFTFDDGANYYLVDFIHWLKEVKKIDPANKLIQSQIDSFQSMLFEITIAKMIGSRCYYPPHNLKTEYPPTSMALYFPEKFHIHTGEDEFLYFIFDESPDQCPFIKNKTNWLEFLKLF